MKHYVDTFSTPIGEFSVALDEHGAVVASAFGGVTELRKRFEADELHPQVAAEARREVGEFFGGQRRRFTLKLAPGGTPFQKRVWSVLQHIPFGQTRSYGQIALELGNPASARAVGRANATNPICLLMPCHRVIGTDGSLTGFAFGTEIKRQLLAHESASKTDHRTAGDRAVRTESL